MNLINVLIRTSYRPELFKRCLDSVKRQTYKPIRVIISYDNENALSYIPEDVEKIKVEKGEGRFFYNLFCNDLKNLVTEGWFFFLDDDDYINHYKSLSILAESFDDEHGVVICQFLRGGIKKQKDSLMDLKKIEVGHIGLPCCIVNYKYKNLHDLDSEFDFGDWKWIKKMTESVKTKFVKLPVVYSEKRHNGKMIAA